MCKVAVDTLLEIDRLITEILAKHEDKRPQTGKLKPSKTRLLRRKNALQRQTAKIDALTRRLSEIMNILRSLTHDLKLDRITLALALQRVELIPDTACAPGSADESLIDAELGKILQQTIDSDNRSRSDVPFVSRTSPSLSQKSSLDSFHSAIADSSGSSASLVSVSGSIITQDCDITCACQCHQMSRLMTPSWASFVFGTMSFHGNTSMLLQRRPCDKACRRSGMHFLRFSYFAPCWLFLRSFNFWVQLRSFQKPEIGIAHVIPYDAVVWALVETGNLQKLRELICRETAYLNAVSPSGKSLLNVSKSTLLRQTANIGHSVCSSKWSRRGV